MYNNESENNLYHYSYRDNSPNPYMRETVGTSSPVTPPPTPPKKKKKSHLGLKVTALAICCALLGGLTGAGTVYVLTRNEPETQQSQQIPQLDSASDESKDETVGQIEHVYTSVGEGIDAAGIYEANVGSTVSINCSGETTNIFGQVTESASSGSGFVVTEDGYIVTNYHVIKGATGVEVNFDSGESYSAEIIGGDEAYDIAVLKIDAKVEPVVLGDSDTVEEGESIVVIGNPLGELSFSISRGIVSSCNRAINVGGMPFNMIQIDASINPGNSGGPLFNAAGEVIGIVSAKYSSYSTTTVEGIGFAIPINDVSAMIDDIMSNGYVTNKPYLAITGGTMNESMAQQAGLVEGVYVYSVEAGGAAEQAGIQVGDVITKIDDHVITSMEDLTVVKKSYSAGDTAIFSVYRGGKTLELSFTFDSMPADTITSEPSDVPSTTPDTGGGYFNPGYDIFDYFFR